MQSLIGEEPMVLPLFYFLECVNGEPKADSC